MNTLENNKKEPTQYYVICQCGKEGLDTVRFCRVCRAPGTIGIKWKTHEAWFHGHKDKKVYVEAVDENTLRKMVLASNAFPGSKLRFVGFKRIHISYREHPKPKPVITLTDEEMDLLARWLEQEASKMKNDIEHEGEDRMYKFSNKLKQSFVDGLVSTKTYLKHVDH